MTDLPALHSLPDAARLLSERGSKIGVGILRTAIQRGQLSCTRIGGKVFVTESQLAEMIDQCQHTKKAPGSTSAPEKAESPDGSSETDRTRSAQVAALATIKALRKRSQTTSRGSTSRRNAKAS